MYLGHNALRLTLDIIKQKPPLASFEALANQFGMNYAELINRINDSILECINFLKSQGYKRDHIINLLLKSTNVDFSSLVDQIFTSHRDPKFRWDHEVSIIIPVGQEDLIVQMAHAYVAPIIILPEESAIAIAANSIPEQGIDYTVDEVNKVGKVINLRVTSAMRDYMLNNLPRGAIIESSLLESHLQELGWKQLIIPEVIE